MDDKFGWLFGTKVMENEFFQRSTYYKGRFIIELFILNGFNSL